MKKKVFIVVSLVFIFGLQNVFAQKKTETERQVSRIRSGVLRTNKLLSIFKKTTKVVEGVSTEGTEVTFYKSTAGLKKMHAEIAGETFYVKTDYYYSDRGELVFIFSRLSRYNTQIGMTPPPKIVRIEEKRIYFANGKMVKKIKTVTETEFGSEAQNSEKDILELEKLFQKAFITK